MTGALRRALAAALLAMLAAGCGNPPPVEGNRYVLGGPRNGVDPRLLRANPAGVIAAELAFARAAQEKGQWTAFAEYAAADAVMFVPQRVNAQQWLKGRANPPQAVRWQPHQVWSSCDGSLAVTRGAWQRPDGSVGYFTTVWERQDDLDYKWVMDQGDLLETPLEAPEMIAAVTADCGPSAGQARTGALVEPPHVTEGGASLDDTLRWVVHVRPDNGRTIRVLIRKGEAMETAFEADVAAPAAT